MQFNRNDLSEKIQKMTQGKERLEFSLLPNGFLRMKQERAVDCADYALYYNGSTYHRNGFDFAASKEIPETGAFVCALSGSKFIAERSDGDMEFSSKKKPLTADFSCVLLLRAVDRIIFLVADGTFAPEAFLITLMDNPENERFARAVMKDLISKRNAESALRLFDRKEDIDDGEEA